MADQDGTHEIAEYVPRRRESIAGFEEQFRAADKYNELSECMVALEGRQLEVNRQHKSDLERLENILRQQQLKTDNVLMAQHKLSNIQRERVQESESKYSDLVEEQTRYNANQSELNKALREVLYNLEQREAVNHERNALFQKIVAERARLERAVVPVSGPDHSAFEREQREFNLKSGQQYSVIRQDFDNFQVAQREQHENACQKLNSLSDHQYALERTQSEHMTITKNNENKLHEVDKLLDTFYSEQKRISECMINRCTELAEQQNSMQGVQSAQLEINRHNEHIFAEIDRSINNFQTDQRQFSQKVLKTVSILAEQQNTLQRGQAVQMEVNRFNTDKFHTVDQRLLKMQEMFKTQEQIVMIMAFVMTVLITIVFMKW